jgi:hypothetical protein
MVKDWLRLIGISPTEWNAYENVPSWWERVTLTHNGSRKSMASLLMLVSCEIWNERNARTFKNTGTMPTIVFARIKLEAENWVVAGARHLGLVMLGE